MKDGRDVHVNDRNQVVISRFSSFDTKKNRKKMGAARREIELHAKIGSRFIYVARRVCLEVLNV